jgi:exonuclease III
MRDLETLQEMQKNWKKGEGKAISSRGASGGIDTIWNAEEFKLEEQLQSQFWMMVSLTKKATGMLYSIINVYMPNNYLEKVECWRSLQDLANDNPPQNLIIVGDFNTTRGLKEKRGGSIVRDQFREKMDDLISDLDLFDVPPSKGMYTWNNRRAGPGHIAARLDRFLISNSFLSHPDKASSLILPWAGSDHRPISLLFESQKNWGPIPFRFNPLWMDRPDFFSSILQAWNQWIIGSRSTSGSRS